MLPVRLGRANGATIQTIFAIFYARTHARTHAHKHTQANPHKKYIEM